MEVWDIRLPCSASLPCKEVKEMHWGSQQEVSIWPYDSEARITWPSLLTPLGFNGVLVYPYMYLKFHPYNQRQVYIDDDKMNSTVHVSDTVHILLACASLIIDLGTDWRLSSTHRDLRLCLAGSIREKGRWEKECLLVLLSLCLFAWCRMKIIALPLQGFCKDQMRSLL